MSLEQYASITCFHTEEELWAMKGELEALRAELSATNQQLELAQEKLAKAHRVRDELDRLIQSLIPTLTT
jgi:predicted  nucleic acid-binding Zn-ribbon protein